jgi:HEAT repeat protein
LSVEKMVNWSKDGPLKRIKMEAAPDNLKRLCNLIDAQEQEPDEVRLHAISQLGDMLAFESHPAGIECLESCIRHERNSRIVAHAASVLGRIQSADSVPVLIDVLLATHIDLFEQPEPLDFTKGDESMRLRCAAAVALGKIGDGRAIIPLMSILNNRDENYRLRLASAESLGRLGDEYAVKPLIDVLADEQEKSVYLKESAAKALGMLGDIRAIEPLIDVLESKRGIRDKFNFLKEQIIEAVARIGRPSRKATDSLLAALADEAPSIRLAAVDALSAIGDAECLEALKGRIDDEDDDVAKAAAYAVFQLGGEEAIRDLLRRENLPRFLRDELEGYIP